MVARTVARAPRPSTAKRHARVTRARRVARVAREVDHLVARFCARMMSRGRSGRRRPRGCAMSPTPQGCGSRPRGHLPELVQRAKAISTRTPAGARRRKIIMRFTLSRDVMRLNVDSSMQTQPSPSNPRHRRLALDRVIAVEHGQQGRCRGAWRPVDPPPPRRCARRRRNQTSSPMQYAASKPSSNSIAAMSHWVKATAALLLRRLSAARGIGTDRSTPIT